jgi:C4-dicarboxylate transporter DctM subunit
MNRSAPRDRRQASELASVLITARALAKADVWKVTKVNVHFIGVLFGVLMLVTYVPIIPLALVELFYR